jgi:hypothetical protein
MLHLFVCVSSLHLSLYYVYSFKLFTELDTIYLPIYIYIFIRFLIYNLFIIFIYLLFYVGYVGIG